MSIGIQVIIMLVLVCVLLVLQVAFAKHFYKIMAVFSLISIAILIVTHQWQLFLAGLIMGPVLIFLVTGRSAARKAMFENYTFSQCIIMLTVDTVYFMMLFGIFCSVNGMKVDIF